uniref:Uncharacterized protein n=1 Tax=Arundo donax TaxID=35708 RepID=A0A0A9BNG3_ARUDO
MKRKNKQQSNRTRSETTLSTK